MPFDRSQSWILGLVAAAFFMETLDGTVVATALPQMGRSFSVSPVVMNIGMTAYMLSIAGFVPVSGWIADRFGARSVFAAAIVVFTVASLLCGVSPNLWSFTAARVAQGIGGAAMVPVGRLIVLRITQKPQLIRAMNTITWPGLIAPVLGPPLGGFLVTFVSWRWIFWLNFPLGLAALILTLRIVPNLKSNDRRPLDWIGFLISGAGLVTLVYGADIVTTGAQTRMAIALILLGGALCIWAIIHFHRTPSPLLSLAPLKSKTFSMSMMGGSLMRTAIGAVPFLTPLLFQVVFGLNAFASGGLVLSVFAGNLAMKVIATQVLERFGFRRVLLINGLLTAASLFACAFFTPATPPLVLAAVLFAGGAFRSLQFTALSAVQFSDLPPKDISAANTLSSLAFQLTLGLGVVFGAAALNLSRLCWGRGPGAPELVDFRTAFTAVAVLALIGLVDVLRLEAGPASPKTEAQPSSN